MEKNEQISQSRLAAMKIAEIKATDKEDMNNCVNDMQKFASLESNEAKIVANAIRAKYLPAIAREAGIDDSKFFNLDEDEETVDFAKEIDEDEDSDMEDEDLDMEDDADDDMDMDDMSDDDDEDLDEDDVEVDDDVATIEIEIPASKLEAAKDAVQEALQRVLGEDAEIESVDDEDSESAMHKLSHEEKNMTKQTLAQRRAYRENILNKIASEEEVYPAAEGVKTKAGNKGETDYPVMKMDGENSLKSENPTFVKSKVPTNNADCLQTPSAVEAIKLEGSGDGSLEYTVDWECIEEVPSEGGESMEMFAVPTEMPMKHKTTVASKDKTCECCGYTKSEKTAGKDVDVHAVKCAQCNTKMAVCDKCIEADADCKYCKSSEKHEDDDVKEAAAPNLDAVETKMNDEAQERMNLQAEQFETQIAASLELARVKTSYSCASKLAIAGIITNDEVDAYAEQMLNDNLKSDAMIRQTKLLLKSAQSSAERVAAAAAEKMSVRTASTNGISTTPALSSSVLNSAAYDIQSALKGTWTMPKIED
jgi:hypothetical protein